MINSSGQTIKFMRPQQQQQSVHKIPPLMPRVTQQTPGSVQVMF